jgi:hypothetical protein
MVENEWKLLCCSRTVCLLSSASDKLQYHVSSCYCNCLSKPVTNLFCEVPNCHLTLIPSCWIITSDLTSAQEHPHTVTHNLLASSKIASQLTILTGEGRVYLITGHQGPRGGVALLFPNLGARRGCVVSTMPRPLYLRERPGTHCTEGWVGPGPVWTCVKNLAPTGIRSPDRPARSQSLHRLSYPAHILLYYRYENIKKSHNYFIVLFDISCLLCESYTLGTVRPIYRTCTPLPSKHPILYIFSTNIRTAFFKHSAHTLFFLFKIPYNPTFFLFLCYSHFTYRVC